MGDMHINHECNRVPVLASRPNQFNGGEVLYRADYPRSNWRGTVEEALTDWAALEQAERVSNWAGDNLE